MSQIKIKAIPMLLLPCPRGNGHPYHAFMCMHAKSLTCVLPCRVFSSALEEGGMVKAVRIPDGKRISNARVKPKGDIAG